MAEEVKKPRTRKPRTPKPEVVAEPSPVITETAEQIQEAPKAEISTPVPENVEEPVVETKIDPVIEEEPDGLNVPEEEESKEEEKPVVVPETPTELPKDAPKFEEKEEIPNSPVQLQKLNPNLPDAKSKWMAFIPTKTGRHVLFKGAYPKAARAAKNYNEAKGFKTLPKKIRSN